MGRALTITNAILGSVFLISAVLQYNDPDPWGWGALYLAAAIACAVSGRMRNGWWLALLVGVVALVWAITLSPIIPEIRLTELARSMKAENPRIELSRELLGLVIILVWMAVLVLASRRGRDGPGTPRMHRPLF